MPVAHVGERPDHRDRAAEQERVGDARHGRFPRAARRRMAVARAGAGVQEHQGPAGDVGLDHRRGERALVGQQQRRPGLGTGDDVAAVVDDVEALAEIRGDGLEAGKAIDDAHEIGRALERLADLLHLVAHEGQVAARIGADDQDARARAQARRRAREHRAVEHEALAERVAQPPELLLVVQDLPGEPVEGRADQQRTGDAAELLAQPGRHQGAVDHLSAGLRLLREAGALGAAEQRLRARQERPHGDVVQRMAVLLEEGLAGGRAPGCRAGSEGRPRPARSRGSERVSSTPVPPAAGHRGRAASCRHDRREHAAQGATGTTGFQASIVAHGRRLGGAHLASRGPSVHSGLVEGRASATRIPPQTLGGELDVEPELEPECPFPFVQLEHVPSGSHALHEDGGRTPNRVARDQLGAFRFHGSELHRHIGGLGPGDAKRDRHQLIALRLESELDGEPRIGERELDLLAEPGSAAESGRRLGATVGSDGDGNAARRGIPPGPP